jgi:hypothetical protein
MVSELQTDCSNYKRKVTSSDICMYGGKLHRRLVFHRRTELSTMKIFSRNEASFDNLIVFVVVRILPTVPSVGQLQSASTGLE